MVMEVSSVERMGGNVLVDFYTPTCHPCKLMGPVLDEISRELPGLQVAKVDVSSNPDAVQKYGVMSVPTLMFIKDSKVQEIHRGLGTKQAIMGMIKKHL